MKAAFVLTPAEARRLIARAVIQTPEFQKAWKDAYVILAGGTTNAFIAQELLGFGVEGSDDMFFDALQLRELSPGALKGCAGTYHESPDYAFNESGVAAFDAAFPPKAQVEDTPTQLRFRQMLTTMRPR